jgi:hypothetical protein
MGLVWVHEERDPISEEAFRDEVRRGRHVELRQRILESIQLQTAFQDAINSAITTERVPVRSGSGF